MNNPNLSAPVPDDQVSPSESSFADILLQFEQEHNSPRGQALQGVVIAISDESVFVDVGRKTEGVLPVVDFRAPDGTVTIQKGDKVLVTLGGTNSEGLYVLSTIRVERPKDWSALEAAFAGKLAIQGTVNELVKGGFRVDVGVPAFMPASRSGTRDQAEMEQLIGQQIQCKVIKLDTAEEDVVVDRRCILEEEEKAAKREAFAALQEGTILKGKVRNLTDFGAFIDLGGIDGLLHVGDISWNRIGKPSDVLKTGEEVEVKILKINAGTHKVSLGMKQLTPEPWALAAEKFTQGDRVRGKVSRVADFGAFVELEPGVDGLIHVSEMSWSKKQIKPSEIVKPGDVVEVVVLSVNAADKRIALGLKQAVGDPWVEAEKNFAVGTIVEAPVTSLQSFGAFIELAEGIEGMIHIGDISREKRLTHPSEILKVGQKVKAQVLEMERGKRRIRLGMKQLEPTSSDEYIAEHKAGDVVSGRMVDVSGNRAKVELGDGVYCWCAIRREEKKAAAEERTAGDLSSLTAMLSQRWKSGGSKGSSGGEALRAGQICSFRIVSLDAAAKKIEIELVA
jgi:small subunit ribosomal protein S1